MAAAEARAVWQRTANRCFVQEDAKRAPKLACCQSSCATTKSVDAGPAIVVDELNQNNDTKKVLKDKMPEAYSKNSEEYSELSEMMSKHETIEINPVSCPTYKKTNDSCLGSDYSWIEGHRTEPWWRTTDRDELASFVSQKSLNHFENCDLPPPQKKYLRSHPCANANANDHKTKTASFDWEAKSRGFFNLSVHAQECLNPNLMHGNQVPSAKEEILHSASNKSSSTAAIHDNIMEKQQILEGDPSKAQLMEALCHSQKRAREAEEAARQAYAENEDLVKHFFKQASQVFAYKQWLQLLQLENLYFQVNKVNSKDQLISTLFPMALPSMSRKSRKRKQNFVRDNQDQAKPDIITTYAVAFALGLSLVGAGILLGWTVGWMLPHL
ncbi:hypothetical protein K1719_044838 [Acacia pycnantha]|nr:hypothetical protein K1719_044838 [Acacia pycnantha]